MHDQITSAVSDDTYEQIVLRHIFDWQPTILRLCDLTRELSPNPRNFGTKDAVERAVRDLTVRGWEL